MVVSAAEIAIEIAIAIAVLAAIVVAVLERLVRESVTAHGNFVIAEAVSVGVSVTLRAAVLVGASATSHGHDLPPAASAVRYAFAIEMHDSGARPPGRPMIDASAPLATAAPRLLGAPPPA